MTVAAQTIHDALPLLRAQYAGRLRLQSGQLLNFVSSCGRDRLTDERRESARILANSLCGTGATFGFPEVSDAARYLENALECQPTDDTKTYVELALRVEPGLPAALADPDRLTQVVANLLSNAAKFTRQGSDVDIEATKKGERIQISVRDHGDGIPEDMRGKLFEKFSQADHSNSRERTGTGLGLGLSIARHLMRLMNGDITFPSVVGKGATFYVRLPIAREVGTGLPAQGWEREQLDDLPQVSATGSTS